MKSSTLLIPPPTVNGIKIEWAVKCEKLGAGEILLTSMDEDGQKKGYDIASIPTGVLPPFT